MRIYLFDSIERMTRLAAILSVMMIANLGHPTAGFIPVAVQRQRRCGAFQPAHASLYSQFVSGARSALGIGVLCPLLPEVSSDAVESTATFAMG